MIDARILILKFYIVFDHIYYAVSDFQSQVLSIILILQLLTIYKLLITWTIFD